MKQPLAATAACDRKLFSIAAFALLGLLPAASAVAQRNLVVVPVELRVPGQPAQRLYGESHALVIGAASYTAGWSNLPGVTKDVVAVSALLRQQGFSVTEVNNPTRDQMDAALRNFAAGPGQRVDNRLLVYFAGHGHTLTTGAGSRLGYIVPVDAPRPDRDPGGFRRQAYSMESVEVIARQIEARHVLFLFDSCFSGTIFRSRSGVPDSISDKTSRPVRQFITAGDADQPVPDESVFRRQLEAALRDGIADLNRDGYITGTELGSFLEDTVTNYSRRSQTPRWGKIRDPDLDKGDFVFAVATTPPPPPARPPTPPLDLPSTSGSFSIADLEREHATRAQWAEWQGRMEADYNRAAAFNGSADLQAQAWQRFLQAWAQDNPTSSQDEQLRSQGQERLAQAQAQRAVQVAALVPDPVRQPPAAGGSSGRMARAFKVGYVNSERVLREAQSAKAALHRLEAEFKEWEARLKVRTSADEKARFQEALNKRRNEETALIVEKANQHIKAVFKSQGFDLIVQEVVFAANSVDITDQVIAMLDGRSEEAARLAARIRPGSAPLRIGYTNADRVLRAVQAAPGNAALSPEQSLQAANRVTRSIFDSDGYDIIVQEVVFAASTVDLTDRVILEADPTKRGQQRQPSTLRAASDSLRMGYVNSERVLREVQSAKDAIAKLEREFSAWDRRIAANPSDTERKRFQEALDKRRNEETAVVVEQANRVIKEIFASQRYDLILQDVVFAASSIDITDEVILRLNRVASASR